MLKLGQWLFNLACRLNPAIPIAMSQVVEQRAQELLQQALAQQSANIRLAYHQQAVAQRAARQ